MQRTTARWTCRRWRNTSSVGDMLDELEWPSLEARREQSSLTFFYKIHSYLRDSRQEFAKVGGTFPIFHAVVLLDSSN